MVLQLHILQSRLLHKAIYDMNKKKKLIMLLAMLACMGVSAQDILIDETCPPQFPGGEAALINFLNAEISIYFCIE
jgi:hypothetical protein